MRIEEDIFRNCSADVSRLTEYGFLASGGRQVFTKELPDENFQIVITYNDGFSGRIIDMSTGEEYFNHLREDATGFSARIRDRYIGLLKDIREHCCADKYYESEQARRILEHIRRVYGDEPEFLWKAYPTFAAIRKKSNKKWYALFGSVPMDKLDKGSSGAQSAEVINVKSESVTALLKRKGCYPAYHMNKKCWVSIILDDTIADAELYQLISDSYKSV